MHCSLWGHGTGGATLWTWGHRGRTQPSRSGAGGTGCVGGWGLGRGRSGQCGRAPPAEHLARSFRTELTPPCHGRALRPSPQPPWAGVEARVSLSSMSSARRPHASRVPPQGQRARNGFLFQRGWTPGRGWNPASRSRERLLPAQGDSWPRLRPEVAASYHSHTPTRVAPDTPLHDSATVGLPARWAWGQHHTCYAWYRAGPWKLVSGAPGLRPHGQSPVPGNPKCLQGPGNQHCGPRGLGHLEGLWGTGSRSSSRKPACLRPGSASLMLDLQLASGWAAVCVGHRETT